MNDQAKPTSRPLQRFLSFSVRGMILLVLVIGVWLGWIVRSARIQREAVNAIKEARGEAWYDWQWKIRATGDFNVGELVRKPAPKWPRWLTDALGVDYFVTVVSVSLTARLATDRELARVGVLSDLQSLTLRGPEISDSGMANLEGLTKLRALQFDGESGDKFTDLGLTHLAGLTALQTLVLEGNTGITDDGVRCVERLKNLRHLSLFASTIGDGGLKHLACLTNLRTLRLSGARITNEGAAALAPLTSLEWLDLYFTRITDDGAAHLKSLTAPAPA